MTLATHPNAPEHEIQTVHPIIQEIPGHVALEAAFVKRVWPLKDTVVPHRLVVWPDSSWLAKVYA